MEIYLPDQIGSIDDLSIRPTFHSYCGSEHLKAYLEGMKEVIKQLLPNPLPFSDKEGLKAWIREELPLVGVNSCGILPDILSVYFLCYQVAPISNVQKFIFDLSKRCLFEESSHKITSFQHMDIFFEHEMTTPLVVAELKVIIQHPREYEQLKEKIPYLRSQLVVATRHRELAESMDRLWLYGPENKHSNIRDLLLKCIQKFPKQLNKDLLLEQQFMQMSVKKEFFTQRSVYHLARSIISLTLIRKNLVNQMTFFVEKRHMNFRLLKTYRYFPFGKKPVLAIIVGINLLDKNECFDEKQIALSVRKLIPNARVVQGSTYSSNPKNSMVVTTYMEMEKGDGSDFSLNQIKELKHYLSKNLGKRIERLVPSLFIVRNEEETMRNILILSQEIKAASDIPQLMISFDRHSTEELRFVIILLRVVRPDEPSLVDKLRHANPRISFDMDRVQTVNYIDELPIEANVFRLKITNISEFLRMDFSVNVYLARQFVIQFLEQNLGEVRDYNGGMILKQQEILGQIKKLFTEHDIDEQEILESAYYSLSPIETQVTLPLSVLCMFLEVFLEHFKKVSQVAKKNHLLIQDNHEGIYVVFSSLSPGFNEGIVEKHHPLLAHAISSQITHEGRHYCSYLCTHTGQKDKQAIRELFEAAYEEWAAKDEQKSVVRFPLAISDLVLDPRTSLEGSSTFVVRHLFEGLYSIGTDGEPKLALAEKEEVSTCQTIYRFELKTAYWSNGDRVVAYDFLYSWKKILMPNTPFNLYRSLLYCIKGAKEAYEQKIPLDEVGIYVLGDTTLEVHLRNPYPFFRKLLATTLYFPVNHRIDIQHPDWYERSGDFFVSNGPFILSKRAHANHIVMKKNERFWDAENIKLDELHFYTNCSLDQTYKLFAQGKVDFCNKATAPEGAKKIPAQEVSSPESKILWMVLNSAQYPFNNKKIRKAFALVLEKEKLGSLLPEDSEIASTVLPKTLTNLDQTYSSSSFDVEEGKRLFKEGLEELGTSLEEFPEIKIYNAPIRIKEISSLFCKKQWETHLGVRVSIQSDDWDTLFKRLIQRNFTIATSFWFSVYEDPLYTLNAFRFKQDKVNFPGYDNPDYIRLLDKCEKELDNKERKKLLIMAEQVIEEEHIILPMAYLRDISLCNPQLANIDSMYRGTEKDLRKIFVKKSMDKNQ